MTIKIGLIGFGKIARDEHVPAIAATEGIELVAVCTPYGSADEMPTYRELAEMLRNHPEMTAVVLCQPPAARYASARDALLSKLHVFLEKPPGATLSEVRALQTLALSNKVTLFAGWHSRWSPDVTGLKHWCANREISRVAIEWKEDVRRWHPGQDWVWEPGGFGVLDPGINALSIVTDIVSEPIRLIEASMEVPENRTTPIAAVLRMETTTSTPVVAEFDWRQTGPQLWRIRVEDRTGEQYIFAQGGDSASHTAGNASSALSAEYRAMYEHFVQLVKAGKSDVDVRPLELIADAHFIGKQLSTEAYFD